jgi:CDP-paratose 2-epimerase
VEWFRAGETDRVRNAIPGMRAAGATFLRTHLSWAEYHTPGGRDWYDFLIPTLAEAFDLLPCLHYTPPSLSRTGLSSGAPRRLQDFADFVDHVLTRHGAHFTHIELWNEPNNLLDWDWRQDTDWLLFCEMIGAAAYWAQQRGWKAVLGGPCPFDPNWLDLLGQRGVLATVSAVGLHGFPGTWDSESGSWSGYGAHIREMRAVLQRYNPAAEVWITEAGYSTWRHDEAAQVQRFREALAAPAERLYWYGWQDIPKTVPVQEGLYFDPRHYHLGVVDAAGRPKLLHRLLASRGAGHLPAPRPARAPTVAGSVRLPLILGGAGAIGAVLTDQLLQAGGEVVVFDDLSRAGSEDNLAWLEARHGARLHVVTADLRDATALDEAVAEAAAVFHLAGRDDAAAALADPFDDFAVNVQGTLAVLDAIRTRAPATPLIHAGSARVYGTLDDLPVLHPKGIDKTWGIDETWPVAPASPAGCARAAAELYVLDHARSYGLRAAALRIGCVYGPRDAQGQGRVMPLLIAAARGRATALSADRGRVADMLHAADAAAACRALLVNIDAAVGRVFNLGGGPLNAVSTQALLDEIAGLVGSAVPVDLADRRPAEPRWLVLDTTRLAQVTGWRPTMGWRAGLRDLAQSLALPPHPGIAEPRRLRA